jgi:hypothetical protein
MDPTFKLQPHRTVHLRGFDDYGAAFALWGASDTGFNDHSRGLQVKGKLGQKTSRLFDPGFPKYLLPARTGQPLHPAPLGKDGAQRQFLPRFLNSGKVAGTRGGQYGATLGPPNG